VAKSIRTKTLSTFQTFGTVLSDLVIEAVYDPRHPTQLQMHSWDGRKTATTSTVSFGGCTYSAAPIAAGLSRAVRFPSPSEAFGTASQLTSSMLQFLGRYANLSPDAAALVVAFALGSWFADCFPTAPLMHLLGPDIEVSRTLRLMGSLCRRPILLNHLDAAALNTLPSNLDPTLLVNQRNLGKRLNNILLASSDRNFRVAHGRGEIYAYGAKAFSSDPEMANRPGVRISLPPVQELLPFLTNAEETKVAYDFQSRLLRYRFINYRRVSQAQPDTGDFVPTMREAVRVWLAPICDCPDLYKIVSTFLLQQNREAEGDRMSDDRCVVAEAALFFCHTPDTDHFFVGELAEMANTLLIGRHNDSVLSDKKIGLLLRALGIHGQRVVKGYKVLLTNPIRERIHNVARAYGVVSMGDGIARCAHCEVEKLDGKTKLTQ
jgi:hypothetical protein